MIANNVELKSIAYVCQVSAPEIRTNHLATSQIFPN